MVKRRSEGRGKTMMLAGIVLVCLVFGTVSPWKVIHMRMFL